MKTAAEFVESLVTIDFIESNNAFGHYPFQLYVETEDGKFELNALALDDVRAVYHRVRYYIRKNAKSLFLSIDFPALGDIEHDFVVVISMIGKDGNAYAIPYDTQTGERFPEIHESSVLSGILSQFKLVAFG